MPITWDAPMDRKLLLAILKHHNISVDTTKVAKELETTPNAITKRLQKIKTMNKDGSTEEKSTPKGKAVGKRKSESDGDSPTKKVKTPKSKQKAATAEIEDDEEIKLPVKQEVGDEEDEHAFI